MNVIKDYFKKSKTKNPQQYKKFCFLNNIRSKYLTISLLCISVLLTSYDILILQITEDFVFFLINFKTDIILLVASFVFMIYIFFHQVKTYKEINKQHKLIHGLISVFILCWSAFKTSIYVENNESCLYFYISSVLILSIIYLFPWYIYISQFIFSIFFFSISLILVNMNVINVFYNVLIIFFFYLISLVGSSYIYYLQTNLFIKENENMIKN